MSNMSRNNSTTSLMGFSVHQPQLGAMLEFFPAMGTQQLDDMIDAYIPGELSILDKRTAVTMEFFQHSVTTGELFKFFMVYPTNAAESPASSLQDSTYGSAFASPVVSEPRWSASTSKKARIASTRTTGATAVDFSHIPGMKIMTRDGQDVTNSASRGCKTKEQRDHAHLMRIMKACEACKKKKVRCDPSHKRASIPAVADSKVKKTTKKASSASKTIQASVPPIDTMQDFADAFNPSFDSLMAFDVPAQDSWEQFVSYDEDEFVAAPNVDFNYDFFYDPAGHFSPSSSFTSGFNSGSSSNSASPSQSFTPILASAGSSLTGLADGTSSKDGDGSHGLQATAGVAAPALPYMESGEIDVGNYVDFALYSPESTSSIDDDLSNYSQEVRAASVSEQVSTLPAYTVQQRVSSSHGGSSRSSSVVANSDGLDSSSAFAHLEQYGFDRGTDQGDHMSAGVISSARIRGQDVHLHGVDANSSVGVLRSTTIDTGMLRTSESLVPRGPEDVPRPPVPQDLTAAAAAGVPADIVRGVKFARSDTMSELGGIKSSSLVHTSKTEQQSQASPTIQQPCRRAGESGSLHATRVSDGTLRPTDVAIVNGHRLDSGASLQSTTSTIIPHRDVITKGTKSQVSIPHSRTAELDNPCTTATATASLASLRTSIVRNVMVQTSSRASVTGAGCTTEGRLPQPFSHAQSLVPGSGAIVSHKQQEQLLYASHTSSSQQPAMHDSGISIQQSTFMHRLDTTPTFALLAAIAVMLLFVQAVLAKHAVDSSRAFLEMFPFLVLSSTVVWNKRHLTKSQDCSASCALSSPSPAGAFAPARTTSHAVATISQKIQQGLRRTVDAIGVLQSGISRSVLPPSALVSSR